MTTARGAARVHRARVILGRTAVLPRFVAGRGVAWIRPAKV
jgi:hypothetical protein